MTIGKKKSSSCFQMTPSVIALGSEYLLVFMFRRSTLLPRSDAVQHDGAYNQRHADGKEKNIACL